MNEWIAALFRDHELTRMGHAQSVEDLNLGLGWLYYGLARAMRPATVVVIGSYRGFAPMMFGRALADNGGGGQVHFIDPSHVEWHGDLADRRGSERHQGLVPYQFDPGADIAVSDSGCWRWATGKRDMHRYVREYFAQRREDG